MIASPEVGKRQVFRLVLSPSIVNPSVNRLWLVPKEYAGARVSTSPSPFDSIAADFRQLFADMGPHWIHVLALYWAFEFHETDGKRRGIETHGWLLADVSGNEWRLHLNSFAVDKGQRDRFCKLAAKAGATLSNAMRESVREFDPDSAFAWWMAYVWKHSSIHPRIQDYPEWRTVENERGAAARAVRLRGGMEQSNPVITLGNREYGTSRPRSG